MNVQRLASESAWSVGYGESTCPDRIKPETMTEALNLRGTFTLQVGSQGTRSVSSVLTGGIALPSGIPGESHSFRVSAGSFEREISVTWNAGTGTWDLSDGVNAASSAGADLTLTDLQGFLSTSFGGEISVTLNGAGTNDLFQHPEPPSLHNGRQGGLVSASHGKLRSFRFHRSGGGGYPRTIKNKINSAFSDATTASRSRRTGSMPPSSSMPPPTPIS